MRSMDTTSSDVAKRFAALITRLARRQGYDLTPGTGDRARLADDVGMSRSGFGRMLDGRSLPMPWQYERIADVLHADVRDLLIEAEVISPEKWPKADSTAVRSATSQNPPPTPEAVVDALGITDPMIRSMLIGNIEHAAELQRRADHPGAAAGG